MPDFANAAVYRAIAKRAIRSIPGAKIDPAAVDKKGSTLNIIVAAGAAMATENEARFARKLLALTLDTDDDDELDAVAAERTYGLVTRFGASAAVVPVRLARPAGALAGGSVPAGSVALSGSLAFTLDVAVPFPAGSRGPIDTTATCAVAGLATNIPLGTGGIAGWQDASKLFDPTITIANTEAGAGGGDRELNPQLRARVRSFPSSIEKATAAALVFGALQVPGVRSAVLYEPIDSMGFATGYPILYIADANGNANSSLVGLVYAKILSSFRAAGIPARVVGSVPTFVDVLLSIGYLAGDATPEVQALVRAAVVNAVNRCAPRETLRTSSIVAAMKTIAGVVVPSDAVRLPVGDIIAATGQTFRTTPDRVRFK